MSSPTHSIIKRMILGGTQFSQDHISTYSLKGLAFLGMWIACPLLGDTTQFSSVACTCRGWFHHNTPWVWRSPYSQPLFHDKDPSLHWLGWSLHHITDHCMSSSPHLPTILYPRTRLDSSDHSFILTYLSDLFLFSFLILLFCEQSESPTVRTFCLVSFHIYYILPCLSILHMWASLS